MNDNYTYELEQALSRILELFDPEASGYVVYNNDGEPFLVDEELSNAVGHANEIMYGEGIEFDED